MVDRLVLLVGDPPKSGGQVLPHDSTFATVSGVPYAYIGGEAKCLSCQQVGPIAKAGGPYRIDHNGREVALEGDIVLCKCATPPKLIAKMLPAMNMIVSVDDRIESSGKAIFPSRPSSA